MDSRQGEKCNSLCYRGVGGAMAFFSLLIGIVAIVVSSQRCCGPNWAWKDGSTSPIGNGDAVVDQQDPVFRRLDEFTDVFTKDHCEVVGADRHMECYQRNIWTIVLGVFAALLLITSMIVCCVGGSVNTKQPDLVEEVRMYAEAQRLHSYMRQAEKQAYGAKVAKKEKKREERRNKEMLEMEKMSAVASTAAPATVLGYPNHYMVPAPVQPNVANPSGLWRVV